jgi:hypothetical protein
MSSARSLALKYLRTSGGDQSHEKLQALFNKVSLHRMFMSELETRFKHGVAMKAPVKGCNFLRINGAQPGRHHKA